MLRIMSANPAHVEKLLKILGNIFNCLEVTKYKKISKNC